MKRSCTDEPSVSEFRHSSRSTVMALKRLRAILLQVFNVFRIVKGQCYWYSGQNNHPW